MTGLPVHSDINNADRGPIASQHYPIDIGQDVSTGTGQRIPPEQLRPDGTLTGNPLAPERPIDNKGVPAAVLNDNPPSMDDVMDGMGVSGIGGYVRPASFENQPVREYGTPPAKQPGKISFMKKAGM